MPPILRDASGLAPQDEVELEETFLNDTWRILSPG